MEGVHILNQDIHLKNLFLKKVNNIKVLMIKEINLSLNKKNKFYLLIKRVYFLLII
jgi:hypothetical protein